MKELKKYSCEECGKEATVYWKETVNGKVREAHLCAECAEKKEIGKFFTDPLFYENPFSAFPIFPGFPAQKSLSPQQNAVCPTCGESIRRVRESGVFGCPDCYRAFRERIDFSPFIGKGYSGERLTGKEKPKKEAFGIDPEETKKKEIERLKKELKTAVSRENYEEAARLRDKIRGLEA